MPSFTAREGQDSPLPGLLAAPADLAATAWQQAIHGAAEQASNFAYIIYMYPCPRGTGDLAKCIDYPYTTPLCSNIVAQSTVIVKRNYYTFFGFFL